MEKSKRLDQFYTKPEIAKLCIEILKTEVNEENRAQFIEPSAGTGAFSSALENCISIDLDPKTSETIKADFLSIKKEDLSLLEKEKVVIIGNPPFGRISSLAVKFFNHSTNFGNSIAFILPKTFKKQSIKRRLNPYFHLVFEQDVPKKSFIFNGEEHDVPCVFQIWRRSHTKRDLSFVYESEYFSFVSQENADFAIRRVGGKTGTIIWNYGSVSKSSHYFIKAKNIGPKELSILIEKLDFKKYINSTVGIRSLSKSEIFTEFSNYLKLNGVG